MLKKNDTRVLKSLINRHPERLNGLRILVIANDTELCEKTVRTSINRLVRAGCISKHRSKRGKPLDLHILPKGYQAYAS